MPHDESEMLEILLYTHKTPTFSKIHKNYTSKEKESQQNGENK
jgi:hypothetical protein